MTSRTPDAGTTALPGTEASRRFVCPEMIWRMAVRYWAIAAVFAFALIPPSLHNHVPVLCTWKHITGTDCPTCGMTRAFSFFFHGEFVQAGHFNRGVFVAAPLLVLVALAQIVFFIRRIRKANKNAPLSGLDQGGH